MSLTLSRALALLLVVAASALQPASAVNRRIGVYISGYGGEFWNDPDGAGPQSGNVWIQRGAPAAWQQEGLFDYTINLDSEVLALIRQNPGQPLAQLLNDADMRTRVISNLQYNIGTWLVQNYSPGMTVDLVLMGHGVVGGMLARKVGSEASRLGLNPLRNPVNGSTIATARITVLTVGTPNQGLPLATAGLENRSGYRNIYPTLRRVADRGAAAQDAGYPWNVTVFLAIAGTLEYVYDAVWSPTRLLNGVSWSAAWHNTMFSTLGRLQDGQRTFGAFDVNNSFRLLLTGIERKEQVEQALNYGLGDLIGPGGTLPRNLNSLPNPTNYRSVIGREKANTLFRLAPELYQSSVDPLQSEQDALNYYAEVHRFANTMRDGWRWTPCVPIFGGGGCADRVNEREVAWLNFRTELENLDPTWATVIGAMRTETRSSTRTVYDPDLCGYHGDGPGGDLRIDALFQRSTAACIEGTSYRTETYYYTVTVPLKNDGVMPAESAVWSAGNNPNDRQHNYLYDDIPSDGGYNHLELLRQQRGGQEAQPMRETKEWLQSIMRSGPNV